MKISTKDFLLGALPVIVVGTMAMVGVQNVVQGVFFTDVGGTNAAAAIVFTRDSSDVPTLDFLTTTSDTTQFFLNATTFQATAGNTFSLEGATANASEATFTVTDPTADRTYTFPDATYSPGVTTVTCRVLEVAGMLDQSCFIADRIYTVTAITEIHTVKETGGTLTIMPRKQNGTEAPASGKALLSAGFNGVGTAETLLTGALTSTGADLILAAGDRLALDFVSETAGELKGVVVTFTLIVSS